MERRENKNDREFVVGIVGICVTFSIYDCMIGIMARVHTNYSRRKFRYICNLMLIAQLATPVNQLLFRTTPQKFQAKCLVLRAPTRSKRTATERNTHATITVVHLLTLTFKDLHLLIP